MIMLPSRWGEQWVWYYFQARAFDTVSLNIKLKKKGKWNQITHKYRTFYGSINAIR
jgi:hypothetical protein